METAVRAVCALIPDGLEAWLGHGGNVTVILAMLGALALAEVLRGARRAPREGRIPDAAESETDTTDAGPVR